VVVPNTAFPVPSTSFSLNRFNRFRSQLRSLFTTNHTTSTSTSNNNDNNNSIQTNSISNQFNTYERHHTPMPTPVQPIVLTARPYLNSDFIQSRELPPPYTEEQLAPSNPSINSISTTIINSRRSSGGSDIESTNPTTTIHRIRKRQVPINTLRDRMRQFISGSTVRSTTDDSSHPMQLTTTRLSIDLEEQPTVVSIEDDEQPSSDDDKMLTP
jgi:hypothetical protein